MAPRDKAIQTVKKTFPEHSRAIECEFAESERFRSICADFHACSRALTYWNRIESREAAVHREEYRELHEELEQEILNWLEASEGQPEPERERTGDVEPG